MVKLTFTKNELLSIIKVSETIDTMLYFSITEDGKLNLRAQSRASVILISEQEGFFDIEKWDSEEKEIFLYFIDATALRKKLTLLSPNITLEIQLDNEIAVQTTFSDNKFKLSTRNMNVDMLEQEDDIRYNPSDEVIESLGYGYNSCVEVPISEMKKIKTILSSVNDEQFTISINTDEAMIKTSELDYKLDGTIDDDVEEIQVKIKNSVFNKLDVDKECKICVNENAVLFYNEKMTVIAAVEMD